MTATESHPDELASALGRVLDIAGHPVSVGAVHRLTGGASRETYAVEATAGDGAPAPLILQRERGGTRRHERGMAAEAEIVDRAAGAGVPVPRVVATNETDPDTALGSSFFVSETVQGETIARRILRDDTFATARRALATQAGTALGRLHATSPDGLPQLELHEDELARYREVADELGLVSPTFELTFRWLERHRPASTGTALVHGDFRLGNLIIDHYGLAAVIDWELAHLGDPMEDLGWLCVRAWRFGGSEPVAGVGSYDELFDAYAAESGRSVDASAVAWWERLGTLKWGIMCGSQANTHRTGVVESLELLAIGNRIAEQEYDLAFALAKGRPNEEPSALGLDVDPDAGSGQPSAAELSGALAQFLSGTLQPALAATPGIAGALSFQTRVAANVAAMLEREARAGELQRARHTERIAPLGVANDAGLAAAIRSGSLDVRFDEVASILATSTAERLAIVNPKWLV